MANRRVPDDEVNHAWFCCSIKFMKLAGILLLLAGWGIVLFALALLRSTPALIGFVVAGTGVELMGLFLVFRSHLQVNEGTR